MAPPRGTRFNIRVGIVAALAATACALPKFTTSSTNEPIAEG
jgi:hypothetical protein